MTAIQSQGGNGRPGDFPSGCVGVRDGDELLPEIHGRLYAVNYPPLSTDNLTPSQPHGARIKYRAMEEFDAKGFKERVKLRLTVLGLSPRAASLQAGGSPDLIRNLLRGPNKTMRGDHMVNLARVLQVSVHWLMTGLEDPSMVETIETGVRFGGVVEAGTFRPVNLFNQDEEMRVVPLPPDPRYPRGAQYAFEVVGDSMTEAKILEGMYLLAVDIHAYERLHGEPQDGKLVIVARSRNGDPERELTVKRLRIFRDRLELRPESKNPLWQPLVFPNPPRDGEEVEAQIIAVVLAASWIYG